MQRAVSPRQHAVVSNHAKIIFSHLAPKKPGLRQAWIQHPLQKWAYQPHALRTSSQFKGVPRAMSRAAHLPRTSGKKRVCKPWPGRIERTFSGVKGSPVRTSHITNRERRKMRLPASLALAPNFTSPRARSAIRTASTKDLNSFGSREKALSGPLTAREI